MTPVFWWGFNNINPYLDERRVHVDVNLHRETKTYVLEQPKSHVNQNNPVFPCQQSHSALINLRGYRNIYIR